MSALLLRARADGRVRLRAWLVLILLTGVIAGTLAAAASGAFRTWFAYDRFVAATHGADAFVDIQCDAANAGECASATSTLASLPSVAALSVAKFRTIRVADADGTILNPGDDPCASGTGGLDVAAMPEGDFDDGVNRILVLDGERPARTDASSVTISEPFADRTGIGVGDRLQLSLDATSCDDEPSGVPTEVRVAAIGLMHGHVEGDSGFYLEMVHITPALYQQFEESAWSTLGLARLAGRSNADALTNEMADAGVPGSIVLRGDELSFDVENRFGADVTMLALVAIIGSIGAVLVLGTAMVRQASLGASDVRTLWALGWTRRDLTLLGALEGSILGLGAAVVSLVVLLLLSPLTPLAEARHVDPLASYHVELPVVGVGLVGTWLLVTGSVALGLRRATARSTRVVAGEPRRTWVDRAVGAIPGMPVTMSTGCRLALRGGAAAVPIRSGTAGIVAGLVGVVGAMTFIAGVDHLVTTVRLVGWNWDVADGIEQLEPAEGATDEALDGVGTADQLVARLRAEPDVQAAGYGTFFPPSFDGEWLRGPDDLALWPMSFSTGGGTIRPTVVSGRAPEGSDEVAVSPTLAEALELEAGDSLELAAPDAEGAEQRIVYEVVGITVLPVGDGSLDGAVAFTFEGMARLAPDLVPQLVWADLASGAEWTEVTARAGVDDIVAGELLSGDDPNGFVNINLERSRRAPQLLMLLLGAMVVAVLSHLVVTTVTQRRQEFAVLRALGSSGRQMRATVAWLVTVVASSTLLLAIPIGIFFGRRLWLEEATFLRVLPEPAMPWLGLVLLVPATLIVANLVALAAGRRLTRLATVDNLRSE